MKGDIMKTQNEFNEELQYIMNRHEDKDLTSFNNDKDCFNRYVDMQSNSAKREGFNKIASQMLFHKL